MKIEDEDSNFSEKVKRVQIIMYREAKKPMPTSGNSK